MAVDFTSFPGIPHSAAAARRFITDTLRVCPEFAVAEDVIKRAEPIVSELATNAIRHTRSGDPGETFRVRGRVDAHGVRAEVRTLAPRRWWSVPHVVRSDDLSREHGRGLLLVDALAAEWGTLAPVRTASTSTSPGTDGWRVGEVPARVPEELRAARDAFPHYEICQFHDPAGLPEVTAVLKPPFQRTGLAVLLCAATVGGLAELLSAHPRPGPPRPGPARRYWRYPRP